MNRTLVFAAVLSVVGIGMVVGQEAPAPAKEVAAPAIKKQLLCPVMGEAISTNLYVDAEGKRIYVCCKGCIGTVKEEPAKYIKKLEEAGITLDKAPVDKKANDADKAAVKKDEPAK